MQRMQELLEQDREKLLGSLASSDAAEKSAQIVAGEYDRLLYAFNSEETSDRVREAAAAMIRSLKACASFLDAGGEAKIYGRTEYGAEKQKKGGAFSRAAAVIAALCCCAAALAILWLNSRDGAPKNMGWLIALPLAALIATVLSYLTAGRGVLRGRETLRAEVLPDAEKVYHCMLQAVLTMDRDLDLIRESEAHADRKRLQEKTEVLPDSELELLSQLLETAYADPDDPSSQETVSQIRFYLHGQSVDVLDWDEEHALWFDRIRAGFDGTLRPALVCGGRLLKKGLAAGGDR